MSYWFDPAERAVTGAIGVGAVEVFLTGGFEDNEASSFQFLLPAKLALGGRYDQLLSDLSRDNIERLGLRLTLGCFAP